MKQITTVLILLLLSWCTVLSAGSNGKKKLYEITVNPRFENPAKGGLVLAGIRPQKLFVQPGEAINGTLTLINKTGTPQVGRVNVWLTNGLEQVVGKQSKDVTVPAKSYTQVTVSWPGKTITKFGHAMGAEIQINGKRVARGEEYFGSAENVWEIGIAGGHPVAFTADHVKSLKQIEGKVERYRSQYMNTFEKFFWAPDDFAEMTPEVEKWYSGQARYHEDLKRLKHLCAYGNSIGVLATTYGKHTGSGSAARDIIRAKPEMVYGYGGKLAFKPNTDELAKWDKEPGEGEKYWQATAWASYNMNDPAVVQHGITEIIESSRMFGWKGVRFDGHFSARTGKRLVGGKHVEFDHEMADKQTAANMKALKEQTRKVFPDYVFGYNFSNCKLNSRFYSSPRETIELCKDGGHIMDEYAKANGRPGHPYSNWKEWGKLMSQQAQQVHRLGGHLFPMVNSSGPIGLYQRVLTFAAGAHPNGKSSYSKYNRFVTRYSMMIWHDHMKWTWNPLGILIIPNNVWWQDYVREIPVDDKTKYMVVHLINPPAQATASESEAAQKELRRRSARRKEIRKKASRKKQKPDYAELDALAPIKLYPDSVADVPVKIVPSALDGWTVKRVLQLDPETTTHSEMNVDATDPYFLQVVVPEVKAWQVVVIELTK